MRRIKTRDNEAIARVKNRQSTNKRITKNRVILLKDKEDDKENEIPSPQREATENVTYATKKTVTESLKRIDIYRKHKKVQQINITT